MKHILLLLIFLLASQIFFAQNSKPAVTITNVNFDDQNKQVNITFDIEDIDNNTSDVTLLFSENDGLNFTKIETANGDVGASVPVGTDLQINWSVQNELNGDGAYVFKVVADDKESVQIEEIVAQVDQDKLQQDMLAVVGVRNRNDPDHLNEVKSLFETELNDAGLLVEKQSWTIDNYEATNFIGTKSGLIEEDVIYINDAHYDTVPGSPGADDNGSGVVGVLAGLKILSQYDFEKTIKFIFFDMEEDGLVGSINYVSNIAMPQSLDIQGVLNYEMIGFYSDEKDSQSLPAGFEILFPEAYQAVINGGSRGNFITNIANVFSNPLKETFDEMAATYVPELRVISLAAIGNSEIAPDLRRSDHTPFWEAAYQALMISDGANFRNANYHEDTDTEETIDYDFMSNVVKATIASLAHLAVPIHAGSDVATLDITTSKLDVFEEEKIRIYPNLLTNTTRSIKIEQTNLNVVFSTLSLYDINGLLIFKIKIPKDSIFELEIPNLESGVYLLQLANDSQSLTKYLVKQ
mgnify:CR=1 FL=1